VCFNVSLERLALHYGMLDSNRLSAIGNEKAYGRAVSGTCSILQTCFRLRSKVAEGVMGPIANSTFLREIAA
jgi:hypothetical protein